MEHDYPIQHMKREWWKLLLQYFLKASRTTCTMPLVDAVVKNKYFLKWEEHAFTWYITGPQIVFKKIFFFFFSFTCNSSSLRLSLSQYTRMSRRGLGYTLAEERALLTFLNSRLKASASNDMNFKFTARDWKAAAARVNSIKTGG